MTPHPQPLCCECEYAKYKKKEWIICKRNCVHHNLTDTCMRSDWFSQASHSSQQSERDKVLKEVITEMEKYHTQCTNTYLDVIYEPLLQIVKELRSKGGEL